MRHSIDQPAFAAEARQSPLFAEDQHAGEGVSSAEPLAARVRPRSLEEIAGQQHLLGPGRILRRMIEADRLTSVVLWGPPGTGKTTIAEVIAHTTHSSFARISAATDGVAELRRVVEQARARLSQHHGRTILFIDEIHRFTKTQQDAILPHVEQGTVTIIGATTENPTFSLTSALLSRCRVLHLDPLDAQDITVIVQRALTDPERGLGARNLTIEPEAFEFLVHAADGDARAALNALEGAVALLTEDADAPPMLTKAVIEEAIQRSALQYDRSGEWHYQLISALIKSIRGSDPDAAVYWLARMLEAGEDPLFVSRRLILLAAEDVGLADPQALVVATQAHTAVSAIGLPEGYLPLAEAALYLALAPKSNSALVAYENAVAAVHETYSLPVPLHLRNATSARDRSEGVGVGYRYPHLSPLGFVEQEYLPKQIRDRQFYEPYMRGWEGTAVHDLQGKKHQTLERRKGASDKQPPSDTATTEKELHDAPPRPDR